LFEKTFDVENTLSLKTVFTPGTLPSSAELRFAFNNNSMVLSGSVNSGKVPQFTGTYLLQNLDITALELSGIPHSLAIKALLNGQGTVTGSYSETGLPIIRGSISARPFEIFKKGQTLPLLTVTAQGIFNGDTLHISKATGSFGLTSASCSGDMHFGINPLGRFTVDVSYLDLDDFIETILKLKHSFEAYDATASSPRPPAPEEKSFFRRFVLDAPTTVKNGRFLSWSFNDGTTRISIKNGVMTYGDINIQAYRGVVNGSVIHDFSQPDIYRLSFLPIADGIEFEEFLPELQAKKVIAGPINLDGMFTSLYKTGSEIVPNMEGSFNVSMKDAKLGKFTVVSKILSLLSFTEIVKLQMPDLLSRGMPLESVTGRFVMAKGIAHTEDLFMKSPAMNLSAVGDLSFSRKEINLIVGVQPLDAQDELGADLLAGPGGHDVEAVHRVGVDHDVAVRGHPGHVVEADVARRIAHHLPAARVEVHRGLEVAPLVHDVDVRRLVGQDQVVGLAAVDVAHRRVEEELPADPLVRIDGLEVVAAAVLVLLEGAAAPEEHGDRLVPGADLDVTARQRDDLQRAAAEREGPIVSLHRLIGRGPRPGLDRGRVLQAEEVEQATRRALQRVVRVVLHAAALGREGGGREQRGEAEPGPGGTATHGVLRCSPGAASVWFFMPTTPRWQT